MHVCTQKLTHYSKNLEDAFWVLQGFSSRVRRLIHRIKKHKRRHASEELEMQEGCAVATHDEGKHV